MRSKVKRVSAYPRGRRGDPTWATCFHEAGHAIAAWYTGTWFEDMQVWSARENAAANDGDDAQRFRGVVRGASRLKKTWDHYKWHRGINEHTHYQVERPEEYRGRRAAKLDLDARIELMVTIGGPAAEAIFRRSSFDQVLMFQVFDDGATDHLYFITGLAAVTGDATDPYKHPLSQLIQGEVRALLKTPRIWGAVEALARALRDRRRLEYDEVIGIIEGATGEGDRDPWWLHELIASDRLTAPLPTHIAPN